MRITVVESSTRYFVDWSLALLFLQTDYFAKLEPPHNTSIESANSSKLAAYRSSCGAPAERGTRAVAERAG
jgi:hypothetical protein